MALFKRLSWNALRCCRRQPCQDLCSKIWRRGSRQGSAIFKRVFGHERYAAGKKPRPPCLEASLKCRSCRKGRWAPPVRMLKLTEARSITAYKWVHPDEER